MVDFVTRERYSPEERDEYEDSLKVYRDLKNVIDTAVEEASTKAKAEGYKEGIKEGIKKEKLAIAVSLKNAGMSLQQIIEITGLPQDEVERL